MVNSTLNRMTAAKFWLLTLMGLVALILAIVNVILIAGNQVIRQEATQRQQYINQSIGLGRLHNQLVQGLARLSVQTGDASLRDLLARHGINVSVRQSQETTTPDQSTRTETSDDSR